MYEAHFPIFESSFCVFESSCWFTSTSITLHPSLRRSSDRLLPIAAPVTRATLPFKSFMIFLLRINKGGTGWFLLGFGLLGIPLDCEALFTDVHGALLVLLEVLQLGRHKPGDTVDEELGALDLAGIEGLVLFARGGSQT